MNKNQIEVLEKFLDSECSDFDLSYNWEWNEDEVCFDVAVYRDKYTSNQKCKCIELRFDVQAEKHQQLKIQLTERCWYGVSSSNETVKYFWMLICPTLF